MSNAPAGIGHNVGSLAKNIAERLTETYRGIASRFTELQKTADDVPEEIVDDETAQKVGDLIKLCKVAMKEADGARKIEKEPYAAAGQQVDAFFKKPIETLNGVTETLQRRLTGYLQEKEARERQKREDLAREQREVAQRKFEEAEAADERRVAAEHEAIAARAKASAARLDKETTIARGRAARDALEAAKRRLREAKANENIAELRAANTAIEEATEQLAALTTRVDELRAEERQAEETAKEQERIKREANRDVKGLIGGAQRGEKAADRLDAKAEGGSAEMSRTRGDLGSLSHLREDWIFRDLKRAHLDLEALRDHLPIAGLEQAVRSWIDANKDALRDNKITLRGVTIEVDTKAVVR